MANSAEKIQHFLCAVYAVMTHLGSGDRCAWQSKHGRMAERKDLTEKGSLDDILQMLQADPSWWTGYGARCLPSYRAERTPTELRLTIAQLGVNCPASGSNILSLSAKLCFDRRN